MCKLRTEIIPVHFKIFRRVKRKKKIKVEGPENNKKNPYKPTVNTNLSSKNSEVKNL